MSGIDFELALEIIAEDIRRLERAVKALEENGNMQAAYDARSWKIAMGRLYVDLKNLADSIEEERLIEASEGACTLLHRIYTLLNAAGEERYMFVTGPSRRILTALLTLASRYCNKG
ncbi:MAG: hypothetical protein GSR73_03890 [Desulfurococcales archaeon]|nr:hypothetical protein [Desulfurococcales archaeon]